MKAETITMQATLKKAGPTAAPDDILSAFLESRLPEDFQPLVAANIERVRRIIHRIVLCPESTEDLVQETFIKAYERIDQFNGKAQFSTWLCSIGVNLARSFARSESRRRSVELTENLRGDQKESTAELESRQELKRIHQAIAGLSIKYRTVIVLSVIEELSMDEISEIVQCPKATLYWRLHQARKILSRSLEVQK
jgi:RNA polymerase sigma-70 factor (ECF subfamily)